MVDWSAFHDVYHSFSHEVQAIWHIPALCHQDDGMVTHGWILVGRWKNLTYRYKACFLFFFTLALTSKSFLFSCAMFTPGVDSPSPLKGLSWWEPDLVFVMFWGWHIAPVSIFFPYLVLASIRSPSKKIDTSQASGAFREMLFASIAPWRQLMGAMIWSYMKRGGNVAKEHKSCGNC